MVRAMRISSALCLPGRRLALALLCLTTASACADLPRRQVPEDLVNVVEVPGFEGVRATAGKFSPIFQQSFKEAVQLRTLAAKEKKSHAMLAMSGGGASGAYSVGILAGWTARGDRPEFDLVTGVSTGALIAPFAFLGSKYDELLESEYTTITSDDIFEEKGLISLIGDESLASSEPLAMRLEKLVTEEFLAEIAAAHARGRRLYVGTTRLDTQEFIVWDMGAIASSDLVEAPALFRQVMLASASVPTFFPPQYIKVTANGEEFDEMHVDGSVIANVFLHGLVLDIGSLKRELSLSEEREVNLYIIRNSQIVAGWQPMERRILPIAERSVMTLLDSGAVGDVFRIFSLCRRDGINFHLTAIPQSFRFEKKEVFDQDDMIRLFKLGVEATKKGALWRVSPPGWTGADSVVPGP